MADFNDVQMAVTEVLALVGCLSCAALDAVNAASAGRSRGCDEPDLQAACEGIQRMLIKISRDLHDLEPSSPEVTHG